MPGMWNADERWVVLPPHLRALNVLYNRACTASKPPSKRSGRSPRPNRESLGADATCAFYKCSTALAPSLSTTVSIALLYAWLANSWINCQKHHTCGTKQWAQNTWGFSTFPDKSMSKVKELQAKQGETQPMALSKANLGKISDQLQSEQLSQEDSRSLLWASAFQQNSKGSLHCCSWLCLEPPLSSASYEAIVEWATTWHFFRMH